MDTKKITAVKARITPVKLMVVTKHRTALDIREAMKAGAKYLGESTLQEIKKKYDSALFQDLKKNTVELHFIGHLQSNKVSQVVNFCDVIQSVDSIGLLSQIDRAAKNRGKIMPVLLQVNFTGEPQKFGFAPDDLEAAIATARQLPCLQLRGLMIIGQEGGMQITREAFSRCKKAAEFFQLPEVSMGMSQDFEIALEEGATMVRLGSILFE